MSRNQEKDDSVRVNGLIKKMLDSATAFSAVAEMMAISERNKTITICEIVMVLYVIYESNPSPYSQEIVVLAAAVIDRC
jgi:hypothetical protein